MKRCLLALILGFGASFLANAQPVPGEYTYSFPGTELPIFHFAENFTTNVGGIDETITMELTPRGRIRGNYVAHYDDGAVVIDINGRLSGRLSSEPPEYHISMAGHGPFRGQAYGRPVTGAQSFRIQLDFDTATGIATGTERATACISGGGCRTVSDSVSFQLLDPDIHEGDWALTLNITNRNNHLKGMAWATLELGRTVQFRVRGVYSPQRDLVKLHLSGTGDAVGVSIHLEADPAMNLRSLRGKLFGQQIEIED